MKPFLTALATTVLLPVTGWSGIALAAPTAAEAPAYPTAAEEADAPPEDVPESLTDRLLELQDLVDRHDSALDRQQGLVQQVTKALPVAVSGSVATRYQVVTRFAGDPLANGPQARLRFSLQPRESGPLGYEVRLVTGGLDQPQQSWVNYAAFLGKTPIALDRYSVSYRPWEPLALTAGKFADPFANSELFWDNDVQPQGLLQSLSLAPWLPAAVAGTVHVGELVLSSGNSDASANAYAVAAKVALSGTVTPWLKLDGALGYYDFINANPGTPGGGTSQALLNGPTRNRLRPGGGQFLSDFNLVNAFARATIGLHPDWPLRLTADYVHNLAAADQQKGIRLAAFVGSVRRPGDLLAVYRFKAVEADAAVSAFAEDIVGGTDVMAHEVSVTGRVFPHSFVEGTAQWATRLTQAGAPLWTFRLAWLQEF